MNDFETDVFDAVYSAMEDLLPEGNFRSEYVAEAESLPLCTLVRMDSFPDWRRKSTGVDEDLTVDTYEAHAFALDMDECKTIMNALSDRMMQMNFRRLSMRPLLNGNDTRIKHIVARFEGRVDNRGYLYR